MHLINNCIMELTAGEFNFLFKTLKNKQLEHYNEINMSPDDVKKRYGFLDTKKIYPFPQGVKDNYTDSGDLFSLRKMIVHKLGIPEQKIDTWNELYLKSNEVNKGAKTVQIQDKPLGFFLQYIGYDSIADLRVAMIADFDTITYDVLLNRLKTFKVWEQAKLTLYFKKEDQTINKAKIKGFYREEEIEYEGSAYMHNQYLYIELHGKIVRQWDRLWIITHLGNYSEPWQTKILIGQFLGTSTLGGMACGELVLQKQISKELHVSDIEALKFNQAKEAIRQFLNLKRNRVWTRIGAVEDIGDLRVKMYNPDTIISNMKGYYNGFCRLSNDLILVSILTIDIDYMTTFETAIFREAENIQLCHIEISNRNHIQLTGYQGTINAPPDIDKDVLNYITIKVPNGDGSKMKGTYVPVGDTDEYQLASNQIKFIRCAETELIKPQICSREALDLRLNSDIKAFLNL